MCLPTHVARKAVKAARPRRRRGAKQSGSARSRVPLRWNLKALVEAAGRCDRRPMITTAGRDLRGARHSNRSVDFVVSPLRTAKLAAAQPRKFLVEQGAVRSAPFPDLPVQSAGFADRLVSSSAEVLHEHEVAAGIVHHRIKHRTLVG
jgi:hypothetical protein